MYMTRFNSEGLPSESDSESSESDGNAGSGTDDLDSDDAAELGIFRGSRFIESGLPPGSVGRIEFAPARVDYRTWFRLGMIRRIVFGPGGKTTHVAIRGDCDLENRPLSDSDDDPKIKKPTWGAGVDAITQTHTHPIAGLLFTQTTPRPYEDGAIDAYEDEEIECAPAPVDYRGWRRPGMRHRIIARPDGKLFSVGERGDRDLENRSLSDSDDNPKVKKPTWGAGSDGITLIYIHPTFGLLFTQTTPRPDED
ncbi:hypothetical protein HID58_004905 [Brassica napus]|uniref:Uncharacterized protein n=1 Tax=Brassica napus TaxID=3708 RepID=A0ABQ8E724_BRANA|nr:uncharacterized protein LOC125583520 [Brassica napus]XP_048606512.1 uncharacterized protein LOC125583520 [Brassica napus]KAH0937444.1 hypothetical protein HID58_004905 [Brassica napus]